MPMLFHRQRQAMPKEVVIRPQVALENSMAHKQASEPVFPLAQKTNLFLVFLVEGVTSIQRPGLLSPLRPQRQAQYDV